MKAKKQDILKEYESGCPKTKEALERLFPKLVGEKKEVLLSFENDEINGGGLMGNGARIGYVERDYIYVSYRYSVELIESPLGATLVKVKKKN